MGQANEERIRKKQEAEKAALEAVEKKRNFTHKDVDDMVESMTPKTNDYIKVYTDGGHNKDGCYGSWLFVLPNGKEGGASRVDFPDCKTNNQAEYEALERALDAADFLGYKRLKVFSDSLLMVQQVNGNWKINDDNLRDRARTIVELMKYFDTITLEHVSRTIIEAKLGH